jgi:hypothetical protein
VLPADNAAGVVLAEVYDADDDHSAVRLVNVSTLGYTGAGEQALTPGFVIRGSGTKRVLIRAIGPGLADLGVPDAVSDPQLALFRAGEADVIASSDDWGGTVPLKAAFAAAGAFALADQSRDAAVLITLPPGAYTAAATGRDNATGMVLVEIYDLDP